MTIKSDEYERFIATLIKDIKATHREIEFLCSGATCRLMGGLGQKHQIDVAFIDRTFIPPKLVLIECKLKDPKYTVGPEVVKVLVFNGYDITQNSEYPNEYLLIICSTSNFTSGTKKLSEALNIKLEHVSFSPDYTFRYANIVSAGIGEIPSFVDDAFCTVRHIDGTED
jgi:hypothetical protein